MERFRDAGREKAEAIIALVQAHSFEDAVAQGRMVANFNVRKAVEDAEQRVRDAFCEVGQQ